MPTVNLEATSQSELQFTVQCVVKVVIGDTIIVGNQGIENAKS